MLVASVGVLMPSCKKEGCTNSGACNYDADAEKDDGTCINKGKVTFWQVTSSGLEVTEVTINGTTNLITSEYPSSPSCDAAGCANYTLCPGVYSYTAEEQFPGLGTWSGTVTVDDSGCLTVWLQ